MDIKKFVKDVWEKVKQDFDDACRNGTGVYWNEEVLRLTFFRHLLNEKIGITSFYAELETHIKGELCYPDLIVHCRINGEIVRCVFEFKFWGNLSEWKEDWNRILAYKETLSFDYGYFLAIGPSTRPLEFPKEPVKLDSYEAEALIYGKTRRKAFGLAPPIKIAEDIVKKTLGMPYHVVDCFDGWGWVTTLPGDYTIVLDVASKEDKLLVLLGLSGFKFGSEKAKEVEKKLKEIEFDKYVRFDDATLTFRQTDTPEWGYLIQELEVNTFPENVQRLRETLASLKSILMQLKPTLELR